MARRSTRSDTRSSATSAARPHHRSVPRWIGSRHELPRTAKNICFASDGRAQLPRRGSRAAPTAKDRAAPIWAALCQHRAAGEGRGQRMTDSVSIDSRPEEQFSALLDDDDETCEILSPEEIAEEIERLIY